MDRYKNLAKLWPLGKIKCKACCVNDSSFAEHLFSHGMEGNTEFPFCLAFKACCYHLGQFRAKFLIFKWYFKVITS